MVVVVTVLQCSVAAKVELVRGGRVLLRVVTVSQLCVTVACSWLVSQEQSECAFCAFVRACVCL